MTAKNGIKSIVNRILGKQGSCKCFYSQEGEDMLLTRIMGNIRFSGSFVDIGAHHPVKFSNTYKFYQAGWRGINIEATPGSRILFDRIRPHDINLEVPISDKKEELTFYVFNHPELNTFSEEHVAEWDGKNGVKVIEKIKLVTSLINPIMEKYIPGKKDFDLLSIDVEGLDLRILKTLDFDKYKFRYIIAEDEPGDVTQCMKSSMTAFLDLKGYKLLSKLYYSNIYVRNEE